TKSPDSQRATDQSGLKANKGGYPMLNSYCSTEKRQVKVDGKIIGTLDGNKFIKTVVGSRHRLRRPPAWALDAGAFDQEVRPNATEVIVIDKETGVEYHASVETFDQLKGELDRGFGRQYFLTLNHWQTKNNVYRQLN
ncbi:hypothetical protein ACFLVX_00460, partial [Chloroflexota bacterium]